VTATVVVLTPPHEEDLMPTRTAPAHPDLPLGLAEIAELLGVNDATPTRWKYLSGRTKFPPPDGHISRTVPYWWRSTIETWARATRRWPGDDVAAEREATAAARATARREAEERRADAQRLHEQFLVLQRELAEAVAAAEEAERRAAEPGPPGALAG
jgi:hypothetical protein